MNSALSALICILFLTGCATAVPKPEGKNSITIGKTTLHQVYDLYGRPYKTTIGPNGFIRLSFEDHQWVTTIPASIQNPETFEISHLDVIVDDKAIVSEYLYSVGKQLLSTNPLRMQWGNPLSQGQIKKLVRGKTTREEAIGLLGPDPLEVLDFDRHRGLIWFYAETIQSHGLRLKQLYLKFSPTGVLTDFRMNSQDEPLP